MYIANRQVRRVSQDWKHPQLADGSFRPLFRPINELRTEKVLYRRLQEAGVEVVRNVSAGAYTVLSGSFPPEKIDDIDPADCMPPWLPEQQTHWQLYETVSEGTPLSPVFAKASDLATWLSAEAVEVPMSLEFVSLRADDWLSFMQPELSINEAIARSLAQKTNLNRLDFI